MRHTKSIGIFFLYLQENMSTQNICFHEVIRKYFSGHPSYLDQSNFGHSLELPQQEDSNQYLKQTFLWQNTILILPYVFGQKIWANSADPDQMPQNIISDQCLYFCHSDHSFTDKLTLVLLNPDMPCLCKQCRSTSVGFWRSQMIWICTVCH